MEPVAGGVHTESERREASYAALASLVREHLDMKKLYDIIGLPLPIKS
jgi:adenosylcobyric acid synthase